MRRVRVIKVSLLSLHVCVCNEKITSFHVRVTLAKKGSLRCQPLKKANRIIQNWRVIVLAPPFLKEFKT